MDEQTLRSELKKATEFNSFTQHVRALLTFYDRHANFRVESHNVFWVSHAWRDGKTFTYYPKSGKWTTPDSKSHLQNSPHEFITEIAGYDFDGYMQVGKYRGVHMDDIIEDDPGYARWIAQNFSNPDVKKAFQNALNDAALTPY